MKIAASRKTFRARGFAAVVEVGRAGAFLTGCNALFGGFSAP
jgi:hypothetical protein